MNVSTYVNIVCLAPLCPGGPAVGVLGRQPRLSHGSGRAPPRPLPLGALPDLRSSSHVLAPAGPPPVLRRSRRDRLLQPRSLWEHPAWRELGFPAASQARPGQGSALRPGLVSLLCPQRMMARAVRMLHHCRSHGYGEKAGPAWQPPTASPLGLGSVSLTPASPPPSASLAAQKPRLPPPRGRPDGEGFHV